MSEPERMLNGTRPPTAGEVARWIGSRNAARWAQLAVFIDRNYPGVFQPQWLFAGKKHGLGLRYKKSRSFCNLVPERGRLKILLVFGAAEREKAEALLPSLGSHVREDYRASTTYHDGRWMFTALDSAKALADVERLLVVKRRPRAGAQS